MFLRCPQCDCEGTVVDIHTADELAAKTEAWEEDYAEKKRKNPKHAGLVSLSRSMLACAQRVRPCVGIGGIARVLHVERKGQRQGRRIQTARTAIAIAQMTSSRRGRLSRRQFPD
jgi:hypothetical protein